MSYRVWQLTRLDRRFHALAGGIPVAGVATLLLALSCGASAVVADGKAQAAPNDSPPLSVLRAHY